MFRRSWPACAMSPEISPSGYPPPPAASHHSISRPGGLHHPDDVKTSDLREIPACCMAIAWFRDGESSLRQIGRTWDLMLVLAARLSRSRVDAAREPMRWDR